MIRRSITGEPLKLTSSISQYFSPILNLTSAPNTLVSRRYPPFITHLYRRLFSNSSTTASSPAAAAAQEGTELTRVASLIDGCDYEHWLVVVDPPDGYPLRHQIVQQYIQTLAMALGSDGDAKRSMYSVSTKYYYAFGCRIPEKLTHIVKSLPNVRWVLPDSYYQHSDENDYGGEPFINGEVVNYGDKYHEHWLQDRSDDRSKKINHSRRSRRNQKTVDQRGHTCKPSFSV